MLYSCKALSPFQFIRNKKYTFTKPLCYCCGLGLLVLTHIEYAHADTDIKNDLNFAQRSRYAHVDKDIDSGKAASILLRLTLKTEWSEHLGSTVEIDSVKSFFNNDHSDGVVLNGKPIIPDVAGTEINQAFFSFSNDDLNAKLGRQRINFDDQRFIGGNGFWQNEQTFDALSAKANLLTNSSVTYAYLYNVNRIFGNKAGKYLEDSNPNYPKNERPTSLLGDYKLDSHLARIEWNEWDYSRWVSYLYLINNKDLPSASNNTLGTSYSFNYKVDALKYRLQIEAAVQRRTEIPDEQTLPYYLADMGININAYEISIRYEILSAKNNTTFITPLGSLNDFQGWANELSPIPTQGIKDASLGFLWRAAPFKIDARYHTFMGYTDGNKLGKEVDVDFVYKPARKHTISLRFAHFIPESTTQTNGKNTRKIFLDYSYNM